MANTLIDCRYETLVDLGFGPSHINEMVLAWLKSEGGPSVTSDVLSDAWLEFLDTFPAISGVPNTKTDRWFALLGSLGHSGTINDREFSFWCDGGALLFWVPNLLGAQFGQLTVPWVPSGAGFNVATVCFLPDQGGGVDHTIWDGRNQPGNFPDSVRLVISIANNVRYFSTSQGTTQIDDVPLYLVTETSTFPQYDDIGAIEFIAAGTSGSNPILGQIHSLKLTDPLDGVVNGRDVVELDGVDQYATVPTWVATNGTIEFDFLHNGSASSQYLIDPRTGTTTGFILIDGADVIQFTDATVELDGVIATSTVTTVSVGQVHHIKITPTNLSEWDNVIFVCARFTVANFVDGFIANLSLTDTDDSSNSRFYPMDTLELVDTSGNDSGGANTGTWFNSPTLTARANNSLDLNFAIRSVDVPTETNIFDQNGNVVGAWNNLAPTNGYVPLLTEPTANENDMVLTVRTTGVDETFTLPFQSSLPSGGAWAARIFWGDGSSDYITTFNDAALAHEYAVADDYDITISGSANCVNFFQAPDVLKLIDVKQWGRTGWTNTVSSFRGCANCVFTAGAVADTSSVTNMASTFMGCTVGNPDVSGFDTSLSTAMNQMFRDCPVANPDLTGFDTATVSDMSLMFFNSTGLNADISGFNIGLVTDMTSMMLQSAFGDANYDLALVSFNNQSHQNTVTAHFGTAQFSAGAPATAKTGLEADGWIITDGFSSFGLTHLGVQLTHLGVPLTHTP